MSPASLVRVHRTISAVLNTIASVWILFLLLLICADVVGRTVFHAPIVGVPEIVKLSIVGMLWLQIAYVQQKNAHLRSTLFLHMMSPKWRKVVLFANNIAGITIFAMVAWFSIPELVGAWKYGGFEGAYPVRIPTAPFWFMIILGALLMIMEYLSQMFFAADDSDGAAS